MFNCKPSSCLVGAATFVLAQAACAVGLPDIPNTHFGKQLDETSDFVDAIADGKTDLSLRLRYEDVTDDIPAGNPLSGTEEAQLLSLRAALAYTTKRYYGLYGHIELEGVGRIGSDKAFNADDDFTFPPGPAGSRIAEGYALIPDGNSAEVNEAFIGWRSSTSSCPNEPKGCNGDTTIKAGRQTIIFDNHRWVGNIVWRQNQQSFDAIRIDNTSIPDLGISYVYLAQVNRLFGSDSPFDTYEMKNSHLINISYKLPFGKLTGYGYLLDFDDNPNTPFPEGVGAVGTPGITNFDSNTQGLRFVGKHPLSDDFTLLSELEFANQDPGSDAGPTLSDNNYYNIELGGSFKMAKKPLVIKIGQEVLEGNGVNALQTPLATVHAFNGWADKFVGAPGGSATPAGGLVDTSLTMAVKGLIGKSRLVLQYHDYQADTVVGGVENYGDEIGVMFAKPFTPEWLGLVKYASFSDGGDGFSFDTDKYWLMLQYTMK